MGFVRSSINSLNNSAGRTGERQSHARIRSAHSQLPNLPREVFGNAKRKLRVNRMPTIARVLETALYVDDLDLAVAFYRDILGLRVLDASPRLAAIDAGQATILLLFRRGSTMEGARTPSGWIPPHDGHGPAHVAFAVDPEQITAWEQYLQRNGVMIESRVRWQKGGRSIYFRDPDGHSVELATPGTWATY